MMPAGSCPQCEAAVTPEVWFCAQCGSELPQEQLSPSAQRRGELIFWGFGLLFMAGVLLAMYLLAPYAVPDLYTP
jgi:hypothetical protein